MRSLSQNRLGLVAALAALNLLLAAAGWLLLVSPQRHHATSATQQVQQVENEISQLGSAASGGTPVARQPLIRTAGLYRLAEAMPTNVDQPDLLLALDQLARSSGVRVLGVSPQTPAAAVGYTVLPITLDLSGEFGSLTHFLHRLRGLVSVRRGQLVATGRLFSVTGVSMTPGTGRDLTANVSVDAFAFGLVGAAAASTDTTSTSTSTTTTTGG